MDEVSCNIVLLPAQDRGASRVVQLAPRSMQRHEGRDPTACGLKPIAILSLDHPRTIAAAARHPVVLRGVD